MPCCRGRWKICHVVGQVEDKYHVVGAGGRYVML